MNIIHILNIADLAFMAAGVGVALVMIVVGARDDRRHDEEEAAKAVRSPPDVRA